MEVKNYSSFVLRLGLGFVFLYFGIGKFRQDIWFHTIKSMEIFSFFGAGIDYFIYLIGAAEIIVGVFLIIGLFTKHVAGLAALMLVSIMILIKFGEIRDIGLLGTAVSLMITGSNYLSVDSKWKKTEEDGF